MIALTNKQKVKAFHELRRKKLEGISGKKNQFLLHLVPETALDDDADSLDISGITNQQLADWLTPTSIYGHRGFDFEFNYDGVRTFRVDPSDNEQFSYGQLLRNGEVEHF